MSAPDGGDPVWGLALLIAGAVALAAGVSWIVGGALRELGAAWRTWQRMRRPPASGRERGPALRFLVVDELGRRRERREHRRARRRSARRPGDHPSPAAQQQIRAVLEEATAPRPAAVIPAGGEERSRDRTA